MLQAKLTVNTPGDKYEQEADRVADMVMRMPEPMVSRTATESVPVTASDGKKKRVQRQCATCVAKGHTSEDCPECKEKKQGLGGTLQRLSTQGDSAAGMAAPPIVSRVLSSPGSPLPADTRSFMESRFGTDFSHVRVHTDSLAAESAAAVQAKAYTAGNHIAMAAGHFPDNSTSGKRLLAHELTHVIQQTGGATAQSALTRDDSGTTVRAKRELPDDEWIRFANKNSQGLAKIKEFKDATTDRNPTLDTSTQKTLASKVYNRHSESARTRLTPSTSTEKGSSEKAEERTPKNTSSAEEIPETTLDFNGNVSHLIVGDYHFVAVTVVDRKKSFVKVMATRQTKGISNWTDENTAKETGLTDGYKCPYTGNFHAETSTYEAEANFGDSDDKREEILARDESRDARKRMPNSDIIYHMMAIAKQHCTHSPISDVSLAPNEITSLVRKDIINTETLITIAQCDGMSVDVQGDPTGARSYSKDTDEYWALLGTPNGTAAGYLATQHTKHPEDVTKTIEHAAVKNSSITFPIKNIV